jgi:hypothetical protein
MRNNALVTSLFALALAAIGCGDDTIYVHEGKLYQVAITQNTAPTYMGDEDAIYIVETRVDLPVVQPSPVQWDARQKEASKYGKLPFPRMPWVERGDMELTVDFTLSNLDTMPHDVTVIVNGANEFDEYVPGVLIVEDNPVPLHSQWERRYTVPPKSRITRSVREEELDEAAVDLATVVNGAPNSDEVVYFENKSESDPRSMKYVPKLIPGLVAMRLGLLTTEAVPVLLEATVRVRDVGEKIAHGDDKLMHPNPQIFRPVIPEQ